MRLLIIEDEMAIVMPLKAAFEKRLFAVDFANEGEAGFEKARLNQYDCLILDLNLPEMDGLEVARRLRTEGNTTPILMLTARTNLNNIYDGFEKGADDYLTKPFDFKELLYRVNALIKRTTQTVEETNLIIADITLDVKSLKVFKADKNIALNGKEYGILEYLLRNKGRVISQEELLEHVWNEDIDSFTQTVKTNIKTLRKKIDPNKTIIKTIRGKGYTIG